MRRRRIAGDADAVCTSGVERSSLSAMQSAALCCAQDGVDLVGEPGLVAELEGDAEWRRGLKCGELEEAGEEVARRP